MALTLVTTDDVTHDGWENPITGIGGARDKSSGFVFAGGDDFLWDSWRLTELYENDDMTATIVDAVVDEAMRKGVSIQSASNSEQIEGIEDWLERLEVIDKVTTARKWARLFGGAAILLGCDDSTDQTKPLNAAGGKGLHFLQEYQKDELTACKYYEDPFLPKFGRPSHYRISPINLTRMSRGNLVVHESRLVIFDGVNTTKTKRLQRDGWGSSVLNRVMPVIKQFNGAFATALATMADANQNVLRIKNFIKMLEKGNGEALQTRLDIMDEYRSQVRALVMDADGEEFVRSSVAISSGLSDVVQQFSLRLAAAARMPVAILMGQAPAGMNATGENDRAMWHAQADTERDKQIKPPLTRILKVGFDAKNGPTQGKQPDSWTVTFPPLSEPSDKEQAETDQIEMTTAQLALDMGVITKADIAKAKFRSKRQRIMLDDARIAALELPDSPIVIPLPGASAPAADPNAAPALPSAELDEAARLLGPALTETDEGEGLEEAEPPPPPEEVQGTPQYFARKMTEAKAERCPHKQPNKCNTCGIERSRDVETGPDGTPFFPVAWKVIGQ